MIEILRSTHYRPSIKVRTELQPGCWIRCENPSEEEKQYLLSLGIDEDILIDALDPHEVPRVELQNHDTYFITRLPDIKDDFNDFTTPILFVLASQYIITISRDDLSRMWRPFIDKTLVPTTQKNKIFLLMLDAIAKQYQTRVAAINRQMRATTGNIHKLTSRDIAVLADYERRLNDYTDALDPTNTALEKTLGGNVLRLYEDDRDLVEDLSVDLEQLLARCKSLLRSITNSRDSYRAVMDTRLNETIRLLTVITLAMTIPTMLAGIYGMNVPLPLQNNPWTFYGIIGISIVVGLLLGHYFLRRR